MTLEQFQAHAEATWEAIPAELRVDVVGVVVDPEPRYDPEFPDTPLMGECRLDPAVELVAEAPIRSMIFLFYGSFVQIAARFEDEEGRPFDWAGELEETLHHELEHHLDWRQGHDALGDEDDRQRENMLRLRGLPFDRSFHRYCERLDEGVTALDGELFFEVAVARRELSRIFDLAIEVDWRGLRLEAGPAPDSERGQRQIFVAVETIDEPPDSDDPILRAVLERDWRHATVVLRKRKLLFEKERPELTARWLRPDS